MKRTHILLLLAATLAAGACTPEQLDRSERQPILLTSGITPTRGVQDNQLVSGQTVYVWAREDSDWTKPDCFIQAWELTAGIGGELISTNGMTYYYPPSPLSMIALHGNFSFADSQTPFPSVVSHSVLSDQSTAGNLEKSDLLHCRLDNVSASATPVSITFAHHLSKIEISLSSSLFTHAEIDAMTVTLNNVLPTVDLVLSTGSVGVAHGNTIAVHPRKTATAVANSGVAVFEAIIPAQPHPDDFITVRLDGGVVNVNAQVKEFEANTRYPYDLDLTYRDVRKNPLWYVAEYNVNYDGSSTYSWATTLDEGYYFSWNDAQKAFTTAGNAGAASPVSISGYYGDSGSKFSGWHLPTMNEWLSIVPGNQANIWDFDSGSGTYKASNTTVAFGYDKDTQAGMSEASYWKREGNEMHALRYLGTPFCSAWRYIWENNMLVIYATLTGNVSADAGAAAAWYAANWDSVYWGNNDAVGAVQRSFYIGGIRQGGSGSSASGVTERETNGRYQCTTRDGNNVQTFAISSEVAYMTSTSGVAYGRNTRLFRVTDEVIDVFFFSISSSRAVEFSPGNLQAHVSSGPTNTYNYTADQWRFASNQWDYCNSTLAVGNWVDHFSWIGASATWNSYGLCTSTDYNSTSGDAYHGTSASDVLKTDWGAIPGVVSALGSGWRTLSSEEWGYLFNTRTSGATVNGTVNARYTQATIRTDVSGGVNGIILFPDGVTFAAGEATSWGAVDSASDWATKCTAAQWTALEAKGCVFLPAAGYRLGAGVVDGGSHGYCWSASPNEVVGNARVVDFYGGHVNPQYNSRRRYGFSVRLVRDL